MEMADNINICLKEVGFLVSGWIHLADCRVQWQNLVNTVILLHRVITY